MKNRFLNIRQSLTLLVVIFVISLTSAQEQNFLTVRGNKLFDVQGNEVRLTGVNWFGFETQNYFPHGIWTRDMKSVLQQIKDLGFNTIRVPWANEMLNPESTIEINSYGSDPYTGISPMNEEETNVTKPIELMDIFVKWCQENDMKIVLDNHSRAADGFLNEKFWYTPEYSEEKWIEDWVFIADRYKDYSAVVAMDLNNEPHGSSWGDSNPATDWNKAAERCGNAVLEANPNVLIIVEGVGEFEGNSYWWGGQLMGAKKYPIELSDPSKLVYSAHEYGPEVSEQDWFTASNFPQNMPEIWNDNFHYLYEEGTSPLFVGEFGIKNQDAFGGIAYTWFTEYTDFMGDIYSWTFWSMNPNSGDTGGILQDDWVSVNQWKMDVLKSHFAPLIPNVIGGPDPEVNGGTLAGGPFVFTVGDDIADNVSGITLTGTVGDTNQWVITDAQNKILGLPSNPEEVDFDGAGIGSCFIYHLSYNGTITGLSADTNLSELSGDFDLSNKLEVVRIPVSTGGNCRFGTPLATALPAIKNASYSKIYVLGNGGPDLSNVTNLTIDWNLINNGLWQFSMSTSDGTPGWWNDLLPKVSQNFNTTQPEITITDSGFSNLDGSYWVTLDQDNFVMVSKTRGFTIYFSNTTTDPTCQDEEASSSSTTINVETYNNPVQDRLVIKGEGFSQGNTISLMSISGVVMKTIQVQSNSKEVEFNTSNLKPGMYFVKINYEKQLKTLRIIKI